VNKRRIKNPQPVGRPRWFIAEIITQKKLNMLEKAGYMVLRRDVFKNRVNRIKEKNLIIKRQQYEIEKLTQALQSTGKYKGHK